MNESTSINKIFWVDLITPDLQAARAFYHALFNWEYLDVDRGEAGFYRTVSAGGRTFAGMLSNAEIGLADQDAPARWVPYFYSENVDGIAHAASEAGGVVYSPPREIPGLMRMAVIGDPHGGVFSPMQSLMEGADPSADLPVGAPIWYEIRADDANACAAFYGDLFALDVDPRNPPTGPYILLKQGDFEIAGIGPYQPAVGQRGWCAYLRVESMEEVREQVEALGGVNLTGIDYVPNTGRIAMAKDPTGAIFGLLEPE